MDRKKKERKKERKKEGGKTESKKNTRKRKMNWKREKGLEMTERILQYRKLNWEWKMEMRDTNKQIDRNRRNDRKKWKLPVPNESLFLKNYADMFEYFRWFSENKITTYLHILRYIYRGLNNDMCRHENGILITFWWNKASWINTHT